MAYFYRLALALLLALGASGASAQSCYTAPCYEYTASTPSGWWPSPTQACQQWLIYSPTLSGYSRTYLSNTATICYYTWHFNGSTGSQSIASQSRAPDAVPPTAEEAYCTAIVTNAATNGNNAGPRVVDVATMSGQMSTIKTGCSALGPGPAGETYSCRFTGEVHMCGTQSTGQAVCWLENTKYTGAVCDGTEGTTEVSPASPSTAGNPATDPPPPGYCPGTVNGVAVWVPCGTTTESTPKSSTTTTSSPTGTQTTTVTGSDQTTCASGVCTTTTVTSTTITTGTGSTTTTGTTTGKQTQGTYCTLNPGVVACGGSGSTSGSGGNGDGGDGGSFGGSCGAGAAAAAFQCDGDAVMCATAKATNETKCLLSKESSENTAYEAAKAAPTVTGLGSTTAAITSASFSQTNDLGAAVCIGDKTITVSVGGVSRTVVIEMSRVCPYLGYLGNLMLALSMLSSMFIVFKRGN